MERNELIFGSAYYLEYMPENRVKEDIRMMKAAGMNTARIAESTWSTLEPEPGIFCFECLDAMLDALEAAGMMAIIGTPTYAVPSWLVKEDPSVMVTTKDGRAHYGHRQLFDITNRTFLTHAERMIRELMKHTAKRACVIGFQIDNETKHYGTAGEEVQRRFKEYLKEKYGTVRRLNEAFGLAYWSNSIGRWEDFPDITGCCNAGLASEFEAFQRNLAAEYLRWQAGIVREYARPDQFVTHNLDFEWRKFGADIAQDGYTYGIQPDINHDQVAGFLDVAGTDIYHPSQDELTGAETAFGGDEIRSLKKDSYLVLECQAQGFKYWTLFPGQLRLQAYSHLASGAASVMYWNWHSIHNGYETYWKGILSHDLSDNPTYEEAGIIGAEFKRIGKENLVLKKKNKAAVLVDNRSLTAFKWFPIDKDLSYNDVVRWMYDALYEMNLECDIVHAGSLDPAEYRIIVTPALYSVDEQLIRKLTDFVHAGGILISSFKSFCADRNLSVYHDAQPHGMTDVFGMTYNQFTIPGKARLRLDGNGFDGKEYTMEYFAELLRTKSASDISASYDHRYWGIYAGITRHHYGNGTAYYIGCYTDKEVLKKIYAQAFADAGMSVPPVAWPVIVRSGLNEKGNRIHYVLHYSEETEVFCCPYRAVTDLVSGRKYKKGDEIRLTDWSVCVLEESPEEGEADTND